MQSKLAAVGSQCRAAALQVLARISGSPKMPSNPPLCEESENLVYDLGGAYARSRAS